MYSGQDIFTDEKRRLLAEDHERVRKISTSSHLSRNDWKKIRYQVESCGFSEEEVIHEIFDNRNTYFKYLVLRKPTEKQVFQERILVQHLHENSTTVGDVTSLPNKGEGAIWIRGGEARTTPPASRTERVTKSTDFSTMTSNDSTLPETPVLGIAKRTVGEGGAQDNQHHDVVHALKESMLLEGIIVVAVLDGDYWEKIQKGSGMTRRDELSDEFSHQEHIIVTDHKKFDEDLRTAVPMLSR